MAVRLLPRSLPELYAHALVIERDAAELFEAYARCMRDAGMERLAEEFSSIGKEEREQYELLAVGTAGQRLVRWLPKVTSSLNWPASTKRPQPLESDCAITWPPSSAWVESALPL